METITATVNSRLQESFIRYVFTEDILGEVIQWVAENLEPDDVFSEDQLVARVQSNT
jgi:hypothetical protein